jgi:hypothetical protein
MGTDMKRLQYNKAKEDYHKKGEALRKAKGTANRKRAKKEYDRAKAWYKKLGSELSKRGKK